jgi:hypothetical protein
MKRRIFIKLSAYGAAAVSVPLLNSCNEKPINTAIAQPQFLSHIFDSKTMFETGQAYLKQVPAENSKNKLADLLTNNTNLKVSSDAKTVYTDLDKKVRQDFAEGKISVIDGWVLSVTEARQCALYSLMQKK